MNSSNASRKGLDKTKLFQSRFVKTLGEDNLDEENIFYGSYYDIIVALNVSKPTVVNMFKQLIGAGILEKIKNKVYRFKRTDFLS